MRTLGWKHFPGGRREGGGGEDRPKLAEARFRRLLKSGTGEERVAGFVRLVALLGRKTKVDDLARDFLDWNHPTYGPRVRERWAFLYYAAGEAAPAIPEFDSSFENTEDEP
jgi:CRISPR type I-E-associated protein CasB/Cse2